MSLEEVVGNFGRGVATGVVSMADPVGTVISEWDRYFTGAGFSDDRAPETLYNSTYKLVYDNSDEDVDLATGYVPRFFGRVAGTGLTFDGGLAVYNVGGVLAALAVPVITGFYSTAKSLKKYIHDFTFGEDVGEFNEKASFSDGFRYGWNQGTHFYMPLLHDIEGNLTGRGLNNSHIESSIKGSSTAVRRNFASFSGNVVGGLTGAVVSIVTLGILPIYKSIRDTVRTSKGQRAQTYEPSVRLARS